MICDGDEYLRLTYDGLHIAQACSFKDISVMPDNTPAPFERQERYIVIKRSKLNRDQENVLRTDLIMMGISLTTAVVIEEDWPEYERVWKMLETRMTNPCPHCRGHGHVFMIPRDGGDKVTCKCENCDGTGMRTLTPERTASDDTLLPEERRLVDNLMARGDALSQLAARHICYLVSEIYDEDGELVRGDKPPTLDTAPHDLAHGPEVPHHRFSTFHEAGEYAYARGLEVNPTHLPVALDAMRKSGWHLVSLFGDTDSKHVGFIFRRAASNDMTDARRIAELMTSLNGAQARINELASENKELVEQNSALKRPPPRASYSDLEHDVPPMPDIGV